MKKLSLRLLSMLLACFLLVGGVASAQEAATPSTLEEPSLKDDFYAAINAEWLATAEIPADKYSVGGFMDNSEAIEALLIADTADWLQNGAPEGNAILAQFTAFYAMIADHEKREADGMAPAIPYIEEIDALESLAEYNTKLVDWTLAGKATPFVFNAMADMKDAQHNALYAQGLSLILPDPSYYDEANPSGAMLLSLYSDMLTQLWTLYGLSAEEVEKVVQETLAFDALLVPYALTAEEASNVETLYNPISFEEFSTMGGEIDFGTLLPGILGTEPDKVVVTTQKFFADYAKIVNEENFPLLKSWMKSHTLSSLAPYLTDEFYVAASSYSMAMSGLTELPEQAKTDYRNALGFFNHAIGVYYGETYFGAEAREDVTNMVENMIAVYKSRLEKNDWLSEETRAEAIKKLEAISIQIGYPDEIPGYLEKITVDPEKNLVDNSFEIAKQVIADNYAGFGKEVNRNIWPLSASTVNAMYQALSNTITFPAAILQAPFYDAEQSASANYGGIGSVIAHEISHAFDPNGSKFDEYGNMREWWTQEDYAKFEELSQAMVDQFDGLEHAGGKVNGNLTKGENVADAGGLSCALEVVKSLPDGDLEAFFSNWATIWRSKYTPQIEELLLTVDTHAPDKLRANIQLQNIADFFETFDIGEGDGMWRAPEDRVAIW